jgi:hypothetical protein
VEAGKGSRKDRDDANFLFRSQKLDTQVLRERYEKETRHNLIRNFYLPAGTVMVLHVGAAAEMPSMKLPDDTDWTWDGLARGGDIVLIESDTSPLHTADAPTVVLDAARGI